MSLRNSLLSFSPSIKNITGDKVNLILAFIPVLIGIALYTLLGTWVYGSAMDQGKVFIEQYVSEGSMGTIVYWLVATILTILLYFVINYTFVLIITILASPFNDMLSMRTEKKIKGEELESFAASFTKISKTFILTLFNEVKKISFILFLSLIALILGYIPILTPVSLFISVLLLAVGFIDYSWSRHGIKFASCVNDLRRNLLTYSFGGAFFFILITIPIINLIVSPWATSYFTILWVKSNES